MPDISRHCTSGNWRESAESSHAIGYSPRQHSDSATLTQSRTGAARKIRQMTSGDRHFDFFMEVDR
jgi:hypothetical protein